MLLISGFDIVLGRSSIALIEITSVIIHMGIFCEAANQHHGAE